MTFTYTGDPTVDDVAAVRFEIADTDPAAPLLTDEEIAYAILAETTVAAGSPATITFPNLFLAAARCMETLSRKMAGQADSVLGTLSVSYSKQSVVYAQRAAELRAKGAAGFAPQINQTYKHPAFTRDQFDNPYAGSAFERRQGLPYPGDS